MKTPSLSLTKKLSLAVLAASLSAVYSASATTDYWIGTNGSSATLNWSDTHNFLAINTTTQTTPNNNEVNFNWNTMQPWPGPGPVTVNVDGNYGTPGTGLAQAWGMFFTQTNGCHTVVIQPGITLALQASAGTPGGGNFVCAPAGTNNGGSSGGLTPAIAYTNYTTFTGIGGTFTVNCTVFRVEGSSSVVPTPGGVNGYHYTILDMSGLGTLYISNNAGAALNFDFINAGGTRSQGLMYMAHTNVLALNGLFQVGNVGAASSNSLPIGVYLGQTNYISTGTGASNMLIGDVGCTNCFMQFNPALIGGASLPTAYITAPSGNQSAVICAAAGGVVPGYAICDFTGGSVTWIGNALTLGVAGAASTTAANGVLTFVNGNVTFNTIQVGDQFVSAGSPGVGTINVGTNATLQANTKITLGAVTGTVNAGTSGTININTNGTLVANTITNGGAGSAINMTNAIWNVALASTGVTNMTVANFNGGGTTNIINITSITPFLGGAFPLRFHLIAASLTGASTLGLGPLPVSFDPSHPYAGNLDTTTTPGLVDFVLTAGPASARSLTWSGTNGGGGTNVLGGADGDWDVGTTSDWLTNGVTTIYNQFDLATFNDVGAAAQTNINLTTSITPYSITVSNAASLYTISGGGNISGSAGLTKQGTGTLILDNATSNNFTGGVTISGGILQIGTNDTGGSLPVGAVTDNAVLAFDRTDSVTVGDVISGSGAVVSAGGGTLRLAAGAGNTFTGAALATNNSTLQGGVTGAFGAASGTVVVAGGSTLDPNGIGTSRAVSVSGTGVGGNGAIVNSGGVIGDSTGGLTPTLILTGNTTLSYPNRWDLGSSTGAVLTNNGLGSSLTLNGTGANTYFEWRDVKTDPTLANINIVAGDLGMAGSTSAGNASGLLNILSGAGLKFYSDDGFNVSITKQVVINDGALIQNGAGANTIAGGLLITNSQGAQYCQFEIGGTSLTVNSTVTGNGILWLQGGASPLIINGSGAAFTGGVLVQGGNMLTLNSTLGSGITNLATSTLAGSGTANGYVDEAGLFYPGGNGTVGTFTAAAGLTLEPSASLTMDLTSSTATGGTNNDLVAVTGNLTANNNTILINPISGTLASGTYTLMTYTGSLINAFAGAQMVASSRYILNLSTATPGLVQLVVSGNPNTLVWNNGAANGQWDVQTSQNWTNLTSHAEDYFYTSDTVTFDDTISTAANPTANININGGVTVSPSIITNNSTTNNYTISGPGQIGGGASIVKLGASTLTITTTNTFNGNVTIAGGTLKAGPNAALGNSTGTVYITNGGTLDVDYSLAAKPLVISGAGVNGAGALVNNDPSGVSIFSSPAGMLNVTLAGNTTLGGSNRLDFGQLAVQTGFLKTGGSNYNLTILGTPYRQWDNVTADANLGNINVMTTNGGALGLVGLTTLGNPSNNLAVFNGAVVELYADSSSLSNMTVNKQVMLYNGSTFQNGSGTNLVLGPVILGVSPGDNCTNNIGGVSLTFSNAVSGPGNLVKIGGSPLVLAGTNTYTGATVVTTGPLNLVGTGSISASTNISLASGQVLDVSGRADQTLTLASGQTLQGSGTINGTLIASPGATVAPGINGTGTLTVTNNIGLAGTTTFGVGATSNDLLSGLIINYAGTLNLSFVPGSLAAGNSFKLFKTSPTPDSFSGSFSSITPATPGPGLIWDPFQLAVNGTLNVLPAPVPASFVGPFTLSGSTLTLMGSGGTPNGTYHVYSSSNVAGPWTPTGNSGAFDGSGNFTNNVNVNTNAGALFYILSEP